MTTMLARNAAFSRPGRIVGHGQSVDSAEGLRVAQAGFENEQRKVEAQPDAAKRLLDKPQKQLFQSRLVLAKGIQKAGEIPKRTPEAANCWFLVDDFDPADEANEPQQELAEREEERLATSASIQRFRGRKIRGSDIAKQEKKKEMGELEKGEEDFKLELNSQ
ncbi:MAG: hypothetical protein M1836_004416 [Candelina mexicana]|nr:MAG: hypothetical protein M1836_004416 [Candelina mexicana]